MKRSKFFACVWLVCALNLIFGSTLRAAQDEVMVGGIGGELSATPTGAATYTLPIECPSGVGVQPSLALTYSSQSGKGIAGWGWNLSGLSVIMRTAQIPYFEGKNKTIAWDKTDPLLLNGQRLIVQSSRGTDSIQYRLESDPSTWVIAYDIQSWGPSYLKVFTKDGLTLTYGNPLDESSYTLLYANARIRSNAVKMGWNLVQVTDGNGNFMKLEYIHSLGDAVGSAVRKITYGGNTQKGDAGALSVFFDYERRMDEMQGYMAGKESLQQLRLTKIRTSVNGVSQKEYRLSYQFDLEISRLVSIDLYNRGVKQVNPLTFTYGTGKNTGYDIDIDSIRWDTDHTLKEEQRLIAIDSDGDGYSELGDSYKRETISALNVRKYTGNWKSEKCVTTAVHDWDTKNRPDLLFGDFNGNGTTDNVFVYHEGKISEGNEFRTVGIKINDGLDGPLLFDTKSLFCRKAPFFSVGQCLGRPFSSLFILQRDSDRVDVNAYRYPYLVVSRSETGGIGTIGNAYFTVPSPIVGVELVKLGSSNYRDDLWLTLANGANQIMVNNQGTEKWYSDTRVVNPALNIGKDDFRQFVDMNGDGLLDIVYRKDADLWYIAYNRGDYTFDVQKIDFITNWKTRIKTPTKMNYSERDALLFIDLNQDGLMDVISGDEQLREDATYLEGKYTYVYSFGQTSWGIYLNTGAGFVSLYQGFSSQPAGCSCFADFLGKGTISWAHAKSNGQLVITDFGFNSNQNLLTSLTNSLGSTTTLQYKPQSESELEITDNHVGSRINTLQHYLDLSYMPFKSSLFPVFSGCDDGNTQYAYTYGKALSNWKYRGMVGFRYFEKRDVKKNIGEITEYGFPVAGRKYYLMLPAFKTTYAGTNRLDSIDKESYEYTVKTDANYGFHYRVLPQKTSRKGYLAGETTLTHYYDSYDECGNVLIKRIEGPEQTERHVFKYVPHGNWDVNLLSEDRCTFTCKSDKSTLTRVSLFSYDSRGNLTEAVSDYGDVNTKTTRYKDLDVYGHPLRTEEVSDGGEMRVSTVAYTASGRFVSRKVNPLNQTVSYEWDEGKGLLLKSTDRMGHTVYGYTAFDQLQSTTYPNGLVETQSASWVLNDPGSRYRTSRFRRDLPGKTVWTYYDKYGREVRTETYGPETLVGFIHNEDKKVGVVTEYYEDGRVHRVSKPSSAWGVKWASVYTYDPYGRVLTEETPQGTVTTSYGSNFIQVTGPQGTARKEWNSAGQMVKSTTNGKSVQFVYTVDNRLKTAQPESGGVVQMEYDLQGNRVKLVDPDAGTIQWKYDGWGQLRWEKQKIRSGGPEVTTSYYYSSSGVLEMKNRGGEPTMYEFDSYARLRSVDIYGTHKRTYEYDAFDRPVKITEQIKGKTFISQKEYDSSGRLAKEIYPSGYYVTHTYDAHGYQNAVRDADSTVIWKLTSNDAEGRVLKEEKCGLVTEYGYNTMDQLTSIKAPGVVDMRYTYASTGNVKSYTDGISGQLENYTYDNLDRLTSWKKPTDVFPSSNMEYDPSRNRITHKFDHLDNGRNYSYYSTTSNVLGAVEYCSLPGHSITYTDFKKVKTITNGGELLSIDYGVDEQRVYMKVQARDLTERYYLENYEEDTQSGSLSKIHSIYGGNGLAALYIVKSNSSVLYSAYTDRQGSLVALARGNTVAERYAYDPWGNRRNPMNWEQKDSRSSFLFYRGYTMHEHLDSYGLINMNGRVYEPYTGIFLSPDPYVQDPFNWLNYNRYAYCMNNPMKYIDPSGEFWLPFAIIFGAGAINVAVNWDNIDNFWEGAATFIAGSGTATLTMIYGPLGAFAGGSLTGLVNNVVSQTGNGVGLGQIDWAQTGISTIMGGSLSVLSYGIGQWAAEHANVLVNSFSISSPTINSAVSGALGYAAGGYASNYAGTLILTGDVEMAKKNAWHNLYSNLATGAVMGGIGGYQYAKENNLNPWTGKAVDFDMTAKDLGLEGTMQRIYRGEKYPHRNDGTVYRNLPNRKTGEIYLPMKEEGYYREFVHPTPNLNAPGLRRIIIGKEGELYYTPDHYNTFLKFKYK